MELDHPSPKIKTSSVAYTVWLLPIIALILAFWLIYKNFVNAGIQISITFPDATGIVAKKTAVKFRGMEVGKVKKLTVLEDGSGVLASIEMDRETAKYLTDKLNFWLVKPNVGFNGVSGLDTLFSGAYIQMKGDEEAKAGNRTRYFKALVTEPEVEIPKGLLVYHLVTTNAAGVNPGSLIYHRNIQVGSVQDVLLSDDHQSVEVTIAIEPKYNGLVKRASRFWNTSGIKASFDLSGVKVESSGVAAMLIGGIAFSSPQNSADADEYSSFRLYAGADAARDSLEIALTFSADAEIGVGSPIYLDQQQVGAIDSLDWGPDFAYLIGTAKLSVDMVSLMRSNTEFWLEKPGISVDNINVGKLIKGTLIRLSPGTGEPATKFKVLDQAPYKKWAKSGLHLTLTSDDAYGLDKGAEVFYRNQSIGQVQWLDFNTQSRQFELDLLIYPQYQKMVDKRSLFYNLSGIHFNAELSGVQLDIPTVKQLISGGIGVHLGDSDEPAQPFDASVESGSESRVVSLPLYKNLDAALAQLDSGALSYTLRSKDLLSPKLNSPIYYKQFAVGRVSEVSLDKSADWSTITINIKPKFAALIRANTDFWIKPAVDIKANVHGFEFTAAPLLSMLGGGIEMSEPDETAELAKKSQTFSLYPNEAAIEHDQQLITLQINQQTTIKAGAAVKYRDHTVGKVLSVELLADLSGVKAQVKLDNAYVEHFNRSDSLYWLVQPRTRISNIKNIANSIFGDSLAVDKGTGALQRQFVVNQSNLTYRQGLAITLKASQLGSVKPGAPILYKQLSIGEVTAVSLMADNQHVAIEAQVDSKYQHLVTLDSKFWNASGVKVEAGVFSGIKIDTQTVESIIAGGIALATNPDGAAAPPGHIFMLHDKVDTTWLSGMVKK